jgi:hypothetical protein
MTRQTRKPLCASCGAVIRWCHTRDGKRMPLDPDPALLGNVRVFDDDLAVVLTKTEVAQYQEAGVSLHSSHFATCPDAPKWRRNRAART